MHRVAPSLAAWLVFAGTLASQQETQELRIQKLIEQLGDNTRWPAASKQLLRIGKPAVKPILEVIQSDDGIKDTLRTRRALKVLGRMGPAAKDAYSDLFDAVPKCEPDIYIEVLHCLADLVPYSESQGNQGTVHGLVQASIGVIQAMNRENRSRWNVEYQRFSQRLQVDPEAGLEAMIAELRRNQLYRREVAAEVLGRMGAKAKGAIPMLTRAMGKAHRDRNPKRQDDFFGRAAEALIRIAPGDSRSAVAYGYTLLHSPSENERAEAALRIGAFGKNAKVQVRTLIRALRDKSQRVRCEVITALGMIGPDARSAVPELEALANSKDKAIAVRAKAALKQIRGRIVEKRL